MVLHVLTTHWYCMDRVPWTGDSSHLQMTLDTMDLVCITQNMRQLIKGP